MMSHSKLGVHLFPGFLYCLIETSPSSSGHLPHYQVCSQTLSPLSSTKTLETGRTGSINPVCFQNPGSSCSEGFCASPSVTQLGDARLLGCLSTSPHHPCLVFATINDLAFQHTCPAGPVSTPDTTSTLWSFWETSSSSPNPFQTFVT